MKKSLVISLIIMATLMLSVAFAVSFSDTNGHWGEPYITDLVGKNVINGYPDGTYRPEGIVTKAEFMKLVMAASLPNLNFTEVQGTFDHWSGPYVQVARNYEIIESDEMQKAEADEPITRMQVVEILSKCDIGILENTQETTLLDFSDIADITDEERVLLRHAVSRGFINGYPNGTFGPERTLTRAEAATIISKYLAK